MTEQDTPVKIFISYAHKDAALCRELINHLQPMIRSAVVTIWYDRQIMPGTRFDDVILEKLLEAEVILFLVSADFLGSEYINSREVTAAMERHYAERCTVVPVMLRNCDIEYTPFAKLQCLPADLVPVISPTWFRDDALRHVTDGLKSVIRGVQVRRDQERSDEAAFDLAMKADSIDALVAYISRSRQKSKTEQAIRHLKELSAGEYRRKLQFYELEIRAYEKLMDEVAMEIHDNIGQQLSFARMLVRKAEQEHGLSNEASEMIKQSNTELRQLKQMLMGEQRFSYFTLGVKLETLAERLKASSSIQCRLTQEQVGLITELPAQVNVLRIFQELTHNILRHSQATEADLSIKVQDQKVYILVRDNGRGFDYPDHGNHQMLETVRQRVAYYNGTFHIETAPGKGTAVAITIPIHASG